MGNYSVPEEIRRMKPKGTMIKKVKGNYYVYTHSQSKDPETGKWKTDSGKLIGKIIPGVGYCPSAAKSKKNQVTVFDYGQYLLACSLAKDDFEGLKKCFNPDEAMQVFSLAAIWACKGYIGLKAADRAFERSLMHRDYPSLSYSYRRVADLLELIGRQDKAEKFQRLCLEGSGEAIAVDGHVIPTDSENNDLCAAGYKTKELKGEYMNMLVALDVATSFPVATKVYPGYMLDKKDFIDFMEGIGPIENKIILVDMGFFSKENVDYISEHNGLYVVPVSENRNDYKTATSKKRGRLAQFLYHAGRKTDAVEYREVLSDGGRRIIYFKNISEGAKLSQEYLSNLEKGKRGYSEEEYQKQRENFGVIVLETNHKGEPEEIYKLYKSRWSIETYYDRLKNGIHFEELNLDDWALVQGVSFVMLVAGRIDARIRSAAKKVGMSSNELMELMKFLKLLDDGKRCEIHNIKKQHIEVCSTLGLTMDTTQKCLN